MRHLGVSVPGARPSLPPLSPGFGALLTLVVILLYLHGNRFRYRSVITIQPAH